MLLVLLLINCDCPLKLVYTLLKDYKMVIKAIIVNKANLEFV